MSSTATHLIPTASSSSHHHRHRSRSRSNSSLSSSTSSLSSKKHHKKHHKSDKKHKKKKKKKTKHHHEPSSTTTTTIEREETEEFGPSPIVPNTRSTAAPPGHFGTALLAGEGAAIAEFVRKNERIPRRGEVGYSGEQIANFESLGYVMSGSRHRRMEAVRQRKENQVYTAEETRAMVLEDQRKRLEKEATLLEEMKKLIAKREE